MVYIRLPPGGQLTLIFSPLPDRRPPGGTVTLLMRGGDQEQTPSMVLNSGYRRGAGNEVLYPRTTKKVIGCRARRDSLPRERDGIASTTSGEELPKVGLASHQSDQKRFAIRIQKS